MFNPAIMIWILGIPVLVCVVDLVLTVKALKEMPRSAAGRGDWSRKLHVKP